MNYLKGMMRHHTIWLVVLLLLGGVYGVFVHEQGLSSLGSSEIDFAIEDTASVDQVILTRVTEGQDGERLTLRRQADGSWRVNDAYPALQARINTLLATLLRIRVRASLAAPGQEAGKQLLARKHTRVDIYQGSKNIKAYQVGTEGKDGAGTLMKLARAEQPYMVEIPGLHAYLNPRYTLDLNHWRENLLFDARQPLVQRFSIQYPQAFTESFSLYRETPSDEWTFEPAEVPPHPQRLAAYLNRLSGKVYAETFASERYPYAQARLANQPPTATVDIAYFDAPSRTVHLYDRPENKHTFFGWVDGGEELLTVQHFVMDSLLMRRSWFFP